jgi:hypothetical protein
MFLILVFPFQGSAGFVTYRISKNYILVGMDSHSGFNPSDQTCKVAVLHDTHIFAYEEVNPIVPQARLANIAKDFLNMKPDATTSVLLKAWITIAKLELRDLLNKKSADPLKNNGQDSLTRIPLTRGFVGEVKSTGSRWSFAELALNAGSGGDDTMYLNQKPKDIFFSYQYGDLITRAFAENGMKVTEDMNSDATTMERLIQYAIQHAPDPKTIGGVPIVVALQYGTGVHWFAGADQCPRQPI